ncbi:MAG: hypothetical protein KAT94_02230 [Candidatus Aenigmarchaeota archaeon]|nr:hypothetical protein [Candidatus Aenigmarchaeota archaeon]
MNKKEIIGMFLDRGVLLSPEDLEKINEKNYMQILESKSGVTKKKEHAVNEPVRGKISTEEFIKICNRKFEFLRETLLKKIEAVSINKGRKVFSEVAIIGRVKELTGRGFVIEDVTGETEVVTENKEVNAGDVLGMRGFFKENRFFLEQTTWPDIPLDNSPKPIQTKITLTMKAKENMEGFIISPNAEKSENVITGFEKFGMIKTTKEGKDTRIIAYSPSKEINEDDAVKILKKRIIPEEGILENLITEIPDIFWLFNNKRNWTRNYKGVVIISSDENSFAEYGMEGVRFGKI